MSDPTSPAVASGPEPSAPTKPVAAPQGAITLQQAVAERLAKLESARAPTPRLDPVAAEAAETTNQDAQEGGQESERAEGVEQEGDVPAEGQEQADTTDQPAGQEIEITANSEIVLPNGERWSGAELQEGLMKKADYTRKTQALQNERQTLERYTTELRSKVQQVEQDLSARHQQAEESLKEAAAKRDQYAEQLKRIADAQREHVTQWDRVDWDRLQRESPERIAPLLLQRDRAREDLAKAEAEQQRLAGESKAEAEQRQQQEREAYARSWVGAKQALLDHVKQNHPVFMDPQKSDSEWSKIAGTLRSVGMPDEVVQAAFGMRHDPNVPLVSPPMFELIRKAAVYDAAVAQHTKATAPGKAPANGDLGKIRVVKADAPRFRPPPPDKAALGRAQAQFNRSLSMKDAKAVELARMMARRSG